MPIQSNLIQGSDEEFLSVAKSLFSLRPLVPYPGWRFDIDWGNPDFAFRWRKRIWEYFRDAHRDAPLELEWCYGLKIAVYLGNDLSKQLFISGCIDPNEFAFLDSYLTPGMTFVDAGANEGLYCLFAARRVGDEGIVYAFEPSRREIQRLSRNIELNRLANIRVFPVALHSRAGSGELMVANAEHSGQNTLGDFVHHDVRLSGKEPVELASLDGLVTAERLRRIDVIKIDVEGAEVGLLEGAIGVLRTMRPVVLFEVLESALQRQGRTVHELREILRSLDYLIYRFHEDTGRPAATNSIFHDGNFLAAPSESPLSDELYPASRLLWPGPLLSSDDWALSNTVRSRVSGGQVSEAGGVADQDPYLSVVATSRNDDHGGSLLRRMQTFANAFLAQCRRHALQAELILVEWNPPPDRPPLAEAIRWPSDFGPARVRIIEVPPGLHRRYAHAENLPLYQMIAKNVGIQRARGRFVLATNIDILFSDELMEFIAAGRLSEDRMYRIDRYDAMEDVPVDGTVEEQLTYCRRNLLRVNARHGTNPVNRDDRPEKGVTSEVREAEAFPPGTVVFRDGWYPLEQFFGEQYRWAQRVATITLQPPADGCRNLVLELGAPPGADRKQVRLQVFDGTDSLLGELDLTGRCLLNLSLSDAVKSSRVRFLVRGFSPPAAGDTRDLCFRLFWYEWTVPETEQMTSVGARPLNLRWRLSSAIRRSRRIWRRLVRPTSPVRFGVPFSAPLARRLGLRLDADGLSVNLGGAQPAVITTPEDVSAPEPAVVHTNACGDFTLLSREKWRSLRGYPEFDAYSFNIDSIFCYAAHYAGVREEVLEEPIRIYHIEHGLGSGWTPEGQAQLFERLAAKGIPYVDWKEVTGWAAQMRRLNCPMIFNRENWGLSEYELQETVFPEDR